MGIWLFFEKEVVSHVHGHLTHPKDSDAVVTQTMHRSRYPSSVHKVHRHCRLPLENMEPRLYITWVLTYGWHLSMSRWKPCANSMWSSMLSFRAGTIFWHLSQWHCQNMFLPPSIAVMKSKSRTAIPSSGFTMIYGPNSDPSPRVHLPGVLPHTLLRHGLRRHQFWEKVEHQIGEGNQARKVNRVGQARSQIGCQVPILIDVIEF